MKPKTTFLWHTTPLRTIIEGWIVCCILLFPMLPILQEAPPLPFSLYLVQLPLLCSTLTGLRTKFIDNKPIPIVLRELAVALILTLGITTLVIGTFFILGQTNRIHFSYAGTNGTLFFLLLAAPEYLSIRLFSWIWRRWNNLRRQRFAWALTHAILLVVCGIVLVILIGSIMITANAFSNDIWGIPTGNTFAQFVFWLSVIILFSSILFVSGIILFLPPATLFSFLIVRKLTVRLENLAEAADKLRQGNFSIRIEPEGEDEIAQLQANFNTMATDLEKSMSDLQTEKDKVWSLLVARRELVDGITHELRNPTATILGYIESLQVEWQQRPPEEVQQDLATIQHETIRLQNILNDLLTTSQLETNRLKIKTQKVNVTDLVKRIVDTFHPLAWNKKRIHIDLIPVNQALFAMADPLRLEQILVNLVQNAVQHTSPGGLVTLNIQHAFEKVSIEVADTGEGISPDELPHIWEKYHHAGTPSKAIKYGAGLGLSLVKELTEAMDGTTSVKSTVGQGSQFKIELPACN